MTNAARSTFAAAEVFADGEAFARVTLAAVETYQVGEPSARTTFAAVEAWHAGGTAGEIKARTSFAGVEVWRSIREQPYPVFPYRLFKPPSLKAALPGGAESGGVALDGEQALEALDQGGRWVVEFGQAPLWRRDQVLAWRTFLAAASLGTMPVIVPLWDRRHQPFADPKLTTPLTFGLQVWDDVWNWSEDQCHAALTADTARGSRTIAFTYAGDARPTGGEHFSILRGRYGWRLYRITRVRSDAAGVITADIRPPLREWSAAADRLNFDSPRLAMRPVGDIEASVEALRFGKGAAVFEEHFGRYP